MSKRERNLWEGIDVGVRKNLNTRDYRAVSFTQELSQRGVDAGDLAAADRSQREIKDAWIPGVEIFARKVHPQRHRGLFGEFVRRDEGILARIGLWPRQWSAARMFSGTAKGFHVHPPSIPENTDAVDWLRRLYIDEPDNYSVRSYDKEQWDVMFFIQVAHAIRVEGTEDVIMAYGTSMVFRPEFEGRIASEVETAALPESWRKFLSL
jgi:dTDP-4-dehydrorhamnose 3,5-epimerase-like enzyme